MSVFLYSCYNLNGENMEKKKKNSVWLIPVICGVFIIVFILCMLTSKVLEKDIKKYIDFDVTSCKLINVTDTHGGFLGDGEYFAKYDCSKATDETEKAKYNWNFLFEDSTIDEQLKSVSCNDDGCKSVYERYDIDTDHNLYYYFYNRHSDAKDYDDQEQLEDAISYNYSIAIFDADRDILYYYELDT